MDRYARMLLHFLHARDIAQPADRVRSATRDDVALATERGDFLRDLRHCSTHIRTAGHHRDGFNAHHLTTRSVEKLVKKYARQFGFDPAVVVHSLRVTALTTARERGAEIIDLQDWAGHADPQTTLTYIRTRDRLSKSPGYILNY